MTLGEPTQSMLVLQKLQRSERGRLHSTTSSPVNHAYDFDMRESAVIGPHQQVHPLLVLMMCMICYILKCSRAETGAACLRLRLPDFPIKVVQLTKGSLPLLRSQAMVTSAHHVMARLRQPGFQRPVLNMPSYRHHGKTCLIYSWL